MAEETERFAPYAPAVAVLGVIRRLRDRNLPDPLTPEELTRIGVSEGNTHRTLRALRFLGLVDDDGRRTASFDRLGRATTHEYPELLGEVVRKAYKKVFEAVDPATATDIELHNAFRGIEPRGQRDRMVALFQGLCREAEIISGGPPEFVQRKRPTPIRPPQPRRQEPEPRSEATERPTNGATSSAQEAFRPFFAPAPPPKPTVDYSVLDALLRQLPADGRWTQGRRDRWLKAVEVNLDLLIEVVDERPPEPATERQGAEEVTV